MPSRPILQATRNRSRPISPCSYSAMNTLEEACEVGFAQRERQLAVVFAVACEHVEGIELRPLVVPARVQRCEVRDAVGAEHDRLPVDHEMLLAQFQRGRDDQREALIPFPDHSEFIMY